MKTIHILGWGRLYPGHDMEESLRAQRLRGAQNDGVLHMEVEGSQ